MKLSINKESWHFKVAQYGGLYVEERTDICSYFWSLMWAIAKPILFIFGGVVIGYVLLLSPVIALIAWFSGLPWIADSIATMGAALWGGGITFGFMIYRIDQGKSVIPGGSSVAELVGAGYRGWKDKTCVLIEVK